MRPGEVTNGQVPSEAWLARVARALLVAVHAGVNRTPAATMIVLREAAWIMRDCAACVGVAPARAVAILCDEAEPPARREADEAPSNKETIGCLLRTEDAFGTIVLPEGFTTDAAGQMLQGFHEDLHGAYSRQIVEAPEVQALLTSQSDAGGDAALSALYGRLRAPSRRNRFRGVPLVVKIRNSIAAARREERPNVRLRGDTNVRARTCGLNPQSKRSVQTGRAASPTTRAIPEGERRVESADSAHAIAERIRASLRARPGLKGKLRRAEELQARLRLQAFDALLDTGTVSGTAKALGVAPSTALARIEECERRAEMVGIQFTHKDL